MSIDVVCPNGHTLKVKDKYAGKTGRCPHCQMPVQVPQAAACLIDRRRHPKHGRSAVGRGRSAGASRNPPPRRRLGLEPARRLVDSQAAHQDLPKCSEVNMRLDICPHCHMYFSDSTEISRRMVVTCRVCGAETDSTFHRCVSCGAGFAEILSEWSNDE